MAAETKNAQEADTYFIVDTSVSPSGGILIVLDASYDAFARRHGVGKCRVRIRIPDGTSFEVVGSVPIINRCEPAPTRPSVLFYRRQQLSPFPTGSSCTVLPK